MSHKILVKNLRQIVQITDDENKEFLRGEEMNKIKILENEKCGLAVLIDSDGKFCAVGTEQEVQEVLGNNDVDTVIDGKGGVAMPGFVDGHSHPVFAGDRVHEFAMKLAGANYLEVQAAGGGIHFTTSRTQAAAEDDLLRDFEEIGRNMLAAGTTTLEAKSGYGLETETEMKMLRVLDRASHSLPLEISATFCGAHAVPKGTNEQKQTELICGEMIDEIKKAKSADQMKCVENIDVFCEKGVFGVECTEKILEAGKSIGLHGNFHAEELSCLHGAEMGSRIGARAMSHLEEISDEGIDAMAKAGSVGVLLPSTAFILRLVPPPARKMIDNGVIVALGSDFNPNAWCFAMPAIMHLACVTMKLSMSEAIVAATINSAHSIGRGRTHGAIQKGRIGDMVVINAPKWEHIIYRFAAHHTIISHVIKSGVVVYEKK